MKKIISIIISAFLLSGCAQLEMENSLSSYKQVESRISLGDSRYQILGILEPIQQNLGASSKRPPDQYMIEGDKYYVHYQRTSWVSDGITTDDELTPYVFKNDKLVSIGWQALGGPKSTGNAAAAAANNAAQSQALINLGQDLMKTPSVTNTMPTTRTCRVTGTGAYKRVTCF